MASPRAPKELKEAGRKVWKALTDANDLEEWEKVTLLEACRVADRLELLSNELEGADLTVKNSKGDLTANPLLVEARQQGIVYARLIAALRIPDETGKVPQSRPARGAYGVRASLSAVN
ncbi:terminase [Agromyces sp. NPDC127015]|uniref:terminase n=1 Tax=Agromyces sp. NPDC127015 TaxID=3347108 RepID=UPI00365A5BE3